MTKIQLATLLEMMSAPARLYDASGDLVAQNKAAREAGESSSEWQLSILHDLGDGWRLQVAPEPHDEPCSGAATDIGTWANGMAHALRNPLSSIITATGLVQDDPGVGEETVMLLGVVKKEALHLNRILNDFVHYVRPRPPQPINFDLARAVRNTVAVQRSDGILSEEVTVEDALPERLLAYADEVQICQALWNIVQNAAEAVAQRGTLRLSGGQNNERVVLCVADSGPGFSAEDLKHAFDPFYSSKSEGTGLGLSIAHATISTAGGRISVRNRSAQSENSEDGSTSGDGAPGDGAASDNAAGCADPACGTWVCIELPAARIAS